MKNRSKCYALSFLFIIGIGSFIIGACKKTTSDNSYSINEPIRAVDLSFTPLMESYGVSFSDNNKTMPLLQICKNHGINTVRIRLWHTPISNSSSLNEVLSFAKQCKTAGFKFYLDLHYSDTWADPGKQSLPNAWKACTRLSLVDSVSHYTENVLLQFKNQNCLPEYIQIGNEVNQGMLWDFGKLVNFNDTNWNYFKALQLAAINKIKTISPSAQIILHYAGLQGAYDFFSKAQQMQIPFDLVGISYYPWWHGNMTSLKSTFVQLNQLSKPIIIAETAYPFTLNWNDWTNNIVGTSNQLLPTFPASPLGQSNFIDSLWKIITPSNPNQAFGICYWAPEYVAYKGAQDTSASPWENLCLFDFQNNACIGIKALGGK